MDALQRVEKIIREMLLNKKKKKLGLKFNLGLALIGLRTTGSCRGLQNAESKLKEVGEVARVKEREPGTSATMQDIRTTHRQKA